MPRDRTPRWGGSHKHEGPGKPRPRPLTPDEIEMRKLHGRLAAETVDELRARIQREINEMKETPPMPTPPEPERNIVFDQSIGMWIFLHPVDGPCFVSGNFSEVQAAVYEYGFEPDAPSAEDVRNYEQFMVRQGEHAQLNEQMAKYLDSRAEADDHIRVELRQRIDGQWELRAPNQGGGLLFGTSDEALDFSTNHNFTIFADGHAAREELRAAIDRRRGEDPGSVGAEPLDPDPSLSPNGVMVDHDAPSAPLPDHVADSIDDTPDSPDDGAPDAPLDYASELRAAAAESPDPALTNTTALVVSQMPEADSLARASTAPDHTPTPQLKQSNALKLTRR